MRNWGDGAWHNATTILIAAFLLVIPFGLSDERYLFLSIGALVCLFVNPDLDQDGLTLAETLVGKVLGDAGERFGFALNSPALADFLKRLGKSIGLVFAGLWMVVWSFYGAFVPHRSFFSHFPIVGTTLRVVWIAAFTLLVRHSIYLLTGHWVEVNLTPHSMQLALMLAGLAIADFGHYARDMKWFEMERYFGINQ